MRKVPLGVMVYATSQRAMGLLPRGMTLSHLAQGHGLREMSGNQNNTIFSMGVQGGTTCKGMTSPHTGYKVSGHVTLWHTLGTTGATGMCS